MLGGVCGPGHRKRRGMKTTTKMKKIKVRRTDDIRLTTAAFCGKCYCAFV